jgi:hypothetical protein
MDPAQQQQPSPPLPEDPGDVFSLDATRDLLKNLFDVQMRNVITSRMMPLIYTFLLVFDAIGVAYLIVTAFRLSFGDGLIWLLLIGPVLFLAVMITIRVILELVMAAFRIAVRVEQVQVTAQNIAGSTEVFSELPRITFWRGFRKDKTPDKGKQARGEGDKG